MYQAFFSQVVLIAMIHYNNIKRLNKTDVLYNDLLEEALQFYDHPSNRECFPKYIVCFVMIERSTRSGYKVNQEKLYFKPFHNFYYFIFQHAFPGFASDCKNIRNRLNADDVSKIYTQHIVNIINTRRKSNTREKQYIQNSYVIPYGVGIGYKGLYVNVHKHTFRETYETLSGVFTEAFGDHQEMHRFIFVAYVDDSKVAIYDMIGGRLLIGKFFDGVPGLTIELSQYLHGLNNGTAPPPSIENETPSEKLVRLLNTFSIPFHTRIGIDHENPDIQNTLDVLMIRNRRQLNLEFEGRGPIISRLLYFDLTAGIFYQFPANTYLAAPWHLIGQLGGPSDDNRSLRLTKNYKQIMEVEKIIYEKCYKNKPGDIMFNNSFGELQKAAAKYNIYLSAYRPRDKSFMTYVFNPVNHKWRENRQNEILGSWKTFNGLKSLVKQQEKRANGSKLSVQGLSDFFKLKTLKNKTNGILPLPTLKPSAFGYIQKCKSCPNVRDYLQLHPTGNPNDYFTGLHKGVSSSLSQAESNILVKQNRNCFGSSKPNEWKPRSVYNAYTRTYQNGIAVNVENPYTGFTGAVGYPGWSNQTIEQGLVPLPRRMNR
jgi:hypothetical protein